MFSACLFIHSMLQTEYLSVDFFWRLTPWPASAYIFCFAPLWHGGCEFFFLMNCLERVVGFVSVLSVVITAHPSAMQHFSTYYLKEDKSFENFQMQIKVTVKPFCKILVLINRTKSWPFLKPNVSLIHLTGSIGSLNIFSENPWRPQE